MRSRNLVRGGSAVAAITQSGGQVTAKNPDWARSLTTGGSHSLGFQASYSDTNYPAL